MANLTVFSVEKLSDENFKIFMGLYNDFRNKAKTDFKFDLEPLEYEDFISAVRNHLLECLVLFENSIPTGFLIYTTLISYSIELNIIYLISEDNFDMKLRYLIHEFLTKEADLLKEKIVTYPLLGQQTKYENTLKDFGFKHIGQSVLKFDFSNPSCITKLKSVENLTLPDEYTITNWDDSYFEEATSIIHINFKHANDALFDSRFKTKDGTKDIVEKIITSCYGEFLPQYTKIVKHSDNIIGICFANVTGSGLVNIPLVAVCRQHRHKNIGQYMVKELTKEVFEHSFDNHQQYTEINVTTDSSNIAAVKMYQYCGFNEDYQYLQSYKEPNC